MNFSCSAGMLYCVSIRDVQTTYSAENKITSPTSYIYWNYMVCGRPLWCQSQILFSISGDNGLVVIQGCKI